MKAQYGILRFKKYKGPAISPIEAHNERTKEQYASNPDIDAEPEPLQPPSGAAAGQVPGRSRPHDHGGSLPCPQGQRAGGGGSCHRQPGVLQR